MKLLTVLSLILLVSCKSHYSTPLCDHSNKTDLPKVEESYFNNSKISIKRVEFGKYKIPGKGIFTACLVGTTIFGEFPTKGGNFISYKVKAGADKLSLSVTDLKFNTKVLDRASIPYQEARRYYGNITIADNSNVTKAVFIKSLQDNLTVSLTKHK